MAQQPRWCVLVCREWGISELGFPPRARPLCIQPRIHASARTHRRASRLATGRPHQSTGRGGTALARARLRATSLDRVRLQSTGGTAPAQALSRSWLAQPPCTRRSRLAPREFFVALWGALIFLLWSSEH